MRLLIVDDNQAFLENAAELLSPLGDVTCCAHPKEAWALSAQPFDLVVSDYAMPGMTGVDLIRQLRARQPALRSIIVTALPDRVKGFDGPVFEKVPVRPWLEAV